MMRWMMIVVAMFAGACSRAPEEQRLREAVAAMEAAMEAGRPGDFTDRVADDFSGQGGQMDLRQLRAVLVAQTLRHQNISVLLGPLDIRMFGDRATVKVNLVATGGQWLPETGRQIELESHWRLEGGEWLCFRADWQ